MFYESKLMSDKEISSVLDPADIELANAYGPYAHGTWGGQNVTIGNEEALAGRGKFLVNLIRSEILRRYSLEKIQSMTLVDVGCYDGWLLCQLAELPFRHLIGIEPRKKNIEKGLTIRRLLGIETRCEFRQGSIEDLGEVLAGEKAEVVVSTGLLHHLSSTADGVARLHAICSGMLFVETICLPSTIEDHRLRDILELKDLPYFFKRPVYGMTGHKLESGYYDGSATKMAVVSLPSIETLRMFLDVQGFSNIRVVADPEAYSRAVQGGWRSFSAVCLTADVDSQRDTASETAGWVSEYEGGLMRILLPESLARELFLRECQNDRSVRLSLLGFVVTGFLFAHGWKLKFWRNVLRWKVRDRYAREILQNLRHAPRDKIALEYGKCLISESRYPEAEQVLFTITRRLNADWRSVYRAFCLLAWLLRLRGDLTGATRYEEMCLIANPQFPMEILRGPPLFPISDSTGKPKMEKQ